MTSLHAERPDRDITRTSTRSVLVTGGSRGIGSAVVRDLATRGVNVFFSYRSARQAADDLVRELAGAPGCVDAVEYDLLAGDPNELIDSVLRDRGRLDALILNAGTWAGGRLEDIDPTVWWDVVEANLRGCARLTAAAVPQLLASDQGSVTIVASAVALIGYPGDTAYAASKSAMVGFARSLCKEVGSRGMRVNVIAPGFVETDMTSAIADHNKERILKATVLGRFGTAEEIARAVTFLSEDATFCTGAVLVADGGWSL